MIYLFATLATFGTVFLKGFQQKNVIGGHVRLAIITSYFMAAGDVLVVSLIVKGGWLLVFPCGTGAALGMVCAMRFHDRLTKRAA